MIFDHLPCQTRRLLIQRLHDTRLRHLERLLQAPMDPSATIETSQTAVLSNDDETFFQNEWRRRGLLRHMHIDHAVTAETLFRDGKSPRNARAVYWEHCFRGTLQGRLLDFDGDAAMVSSIPSTETHHLFDDVVYTLKANGRELAEKNAPQIIQLRALRRLELHNLADSLHSSVLACLGTVLLQAPSLTELCFFHGRVNATFINAVASLVGKRNASVRAGTKAVQAIKSIEFVSAKLKRKEDYSSVRSLCSHLQDLESVRLSSTITDFDNRKLLRTLFASPRLQRLSLEHNDLEDDAFLALLDQSNESPSQCSSAFNLKELLLGHNAVSSRTVQVLSTAACDGRLRLSSLELRNNQEIGDAGILALAPMLSFSESRLTKLDVRNCHFTLDGATALLTALAENRTLLSLDMSQNFLGSSIGDAVADLLLTNATLEKLHINYVGLGEEGCTERLQVALRSHKRLRVLSVGANRLRDRGALALLEAVAIRAMTGVPFNAFDLSGNLLTTSGLNGMSALLHRTAEKHALADEGADGTSPRRKRRRVASARKAIGELGLLNNYFFRGAEEKAHAATNDSLQELAKYVDKVHCDATPQRRASVYDDEV